MSILLHDSVGQLTLQSRISSSEAIIVDYTLRAVHFHVSFLLGRNLMC
jgi:hypothetical protein